MVKELYKHNGFKLVSLDIRNNTLLCKDGSIFYDFINQQDKQDLIYTTVLIGPNGTGKSNLFRIIIELLKELNDLNKEGNRSYNVDGQFNLKFSVHGDIYEYSNFKGDKSKNVSEYEDGKHYAYLLKNSLPIDFTKAQLPIAIIANSIMLTDKFPFFKAEVFPQYKYLGIRSIAQNASTRAYVRKTVEFIVEQYDSSAFRRGLKSITKFLGISNAIDIFYYTINAPTFFRGDLNPENLEKYFKPIRDKYSNSEDRAPNKLGNYDRLKENKKLITEICNYCNSLFETGRLKKLDYKGSSIRKITFDIINEESFQLLKKDFEFIEHLRQLGMLSAPEVQLKRVSDYTLQESSSGEYHFFSSIVGLMATVKPNSLIFIDEPEASLHPNWQMQYLSFIRDLFSNKEYATSHIFVATHSHFLLSDLQGDNSKIIGLKRNKGIEIVELPDNLNTYGWSAEDVLYNVFNVVSTRNKFVAETIANLLNELSSGDKKKVNILDNAKYEELINLGKSLKESDPLKDVVNSIIKRLNV